MPLTRGDVVLTFVANVCRSETLRAEGWLCPALFKYFDKSPAEIYAKAEALRE